MRNRHFLAQDGAVPAEDTRGQRGQGRVGRAQLSQRCFSFPVPAWMSMVLIRCFSRPPHLFLPPPHALPWQALTRKGFSFSPASKPG